MKVVLPDALHARPANLLVRAAAQLSATVFIERDGKRANARKILEVLSLGACKGDEVSLESADPAASAALAELILRDFDPDLVPEHGSTGAAGIAIGAAFVLLSDDEEDAAPAVRPVEEERARFSAAFARVTDELVVLLGGLAPAEAALFEPERAILEALHPLVLTRIEAGAAAEVAVREVATAGATDLLADARRRLLEALSGAADARQARLTAHSSGPIIVVVDDLTPSLVARLPAAAVGVIAATETGHPGGTSHAAILARGRGLPLAYVPTHVAAAIEDGVTVVLDTTAEPASIWASPSERLLAEAVTRRDQRAEARAAADRAALAPLALGIAVRVNIGSRDEPVPEGADGVGLLRTELVFADRTHAPPEDDQVAAYRAIAARTRGRVVVRLFDAGGDKPLPFLPTDTDARGIALLRAHPSVLAAQVRAIGRVDGDVRVLIPLVRDEGDLAAVRAHARPGLLVGAMIETPAAAEGIAAIAAAADFVCIGTNDLAAETLGVTRAEGPDALDPRVLAHVRRTIEGAHAAGREVTVCGEIAADPRGARLLVGLGVDALSVAPSRWSDVKLGLAAATIEDCQFLAKGDP